MPKLGQSGPRASCGALAGSRPGCPGAGTSSTRHSGGSGSSPSRPGESRVLPAATPTRDSSRVPQSLFTLLDLCVSSLRRGHADILCIVPMLTDDPRRESDPPSPRRRCRRASRPGGGPSRAAPRTGSRRRPAAGGPASSISDAYVVYVLFQLSCCFVLLYMLF